MMIYTIEELEEKSNREIDYLVAEKQLSISTDKDIQRAFKRGGLSYCGSWADMGPIIHREKISLVKEYADWQACYGVNTFMRTDKLEGLIIYTHGNPLRAAAIVYLMMGDEK